MLLLRRGPTTRAAVPTRVTAAWRALAVEAHDTVEPTPPPRPSPPSDGGGASLHSSDIAYKPTIGGWGHNSRYAANFDKIFGGKGKADKAAQPTARPEPSAAAGQRQAEELRKSMERQLAAVDLAQPASALGQLAEVENQLGELRALLQAPK